MFLIALRSIDMQLGPPRWDCIARCSLSPLLRAGCIITELRIEQL